MFQRQPTKAQQTKDILERGTILHMGLMDENGFFIQPVSYGYSFSEERIVLYFCGEKKGRKFQVYQQEPNVSVLIDHLSGYRIDKDHYVPCFESLRANGVVREVNGKEKEKALFSLLEHCGFDQQLISFDNILLDQKLGFYSIDLKDVITKKNM